MANYPIVKGHAVVVWKKDINDLHLLNKKDYLHLMYVVDQVRNALLKSLKIKKAYLIYMDEIDHVHWHIIPRYNEKGYDVFKHKPSKLIHYELAEKIKTKLEI